MTATATLTAPAVTCTDASCQHATSHPEMCTCPCGSTGHGSALRASFPSTAKRSDLVGGFSRAMLAAIPDEVPW